jgi:hypothetical protein
MVLSVTRQSEAVWGPTGSVTYAQWNVIGRTSKGYVETSTNDKTALAVCVASLARLFSSETYLKDGNRVGEPFEIERPLGIEIK